MAGPQQLLGLGQHRGILDAMPSPRLARWHEASLAQFAEAQLGPRHGARADPEGLRQHRLRGVAVQSAAAQTAVAAGFVVEGVRGDRLQEQEVDELLVIAH